MTENDITREEIDADRCIALTASGERCTRPARDDGFCYQHDEADETILDAITADGGESDLAGELAALTANDQEASDEDGGSETAEADESEDAPADEEAGSTEEGESTEGASNGLGTIRGRVEENTAEIVGRPVDGVASIHAEDDGWLAIVELVERSAVPDTQDIIGRYEVDVDDSGNVTGYDRIERYRRGDTKAFE